MKTFKYIRRRKPAREFTWLIDDNEKAAFKEDKENS